MKRLLLVVMLTVSAATGAAQPGRAGAGVHYLYLIRHGLYDSDDRADDVVGNGLNALGREQARLAADRLAMLPVKMTSLVSSNYRRAVETADVIGRRLGLAPVRDSLLHECTPASDHPADMRGHEPEDAAGCESQLELAWAKYARPSPDADARDVLVCHGNVIRWFVTRALGADTRLWSAMSIANASLTVIAVRADGSTRLLMYSDVGHLPAQKQTWTGQGAGWANAPAH